MSQKWLPGAATRTGGHAFAGGHWHEYAVHAKARREILVLIGAVFSTPGLGTDEHVGPQAERVLDGASGSAPSVDTGVKVKRRDTHVKTLRRKYPPCGSLFTWNRST
jgi:hypothetical protein